MSAKPSSHVLLFVLSLLAAFPTRAAVAEEISPDDPRWRLDGERAEVVSFRGRQALYLENGAALVDGLELLDGVIEVDVAFDGRRGFSGVLFRHVGPGESEQFYLRPHQSGNPDATQYTPIFNGMTAWQLYHGPRYAVPATIDQEGWNRVRIVFRGGQAEITVNGQSFLVDELKRSPLAGAVGLSSAFAPAWFSRFRIASGDPSPWQTQAAPPRLVPSHPVRHAEVSATIPEAAVGGSSLDPELLASLSWQAVGSEDTGLFNLSRWAAVRGESNTVLVRLSLSATRPTRQRVRFGFSDRVRVFLGGELLFTGDDGYRTRDYRYLGTIGLFDELSLPLREGQNEVLFAVSESFGGWGLIADLDPAEGVEVQHP